MIEEDENEFNNGKVDLVPYYLRKKKQIIGRAMSESILVTAGTRPLGREQLISAIGTLGDTPFRIHRLVSYLFASI